MLTASALVAFVGVSDIARAEQFYGQTLGLTLTDESPFALVAIVSGATLRITAVDQPAAASHTVLGWNVADIEATVDFLVDRGVHVTRYDGIDQDVRGIWTSPSGAKVAWFLDPDRNNLSLTQLPA